MIQHIYLNAPTEQHFLSAGSTNTIIKRRPSQTEVEIYR